MSLWSPPTVGQVVAALDLDPQEAHDALEAQAHLRGAELAWPIRLLTGFGAWLAGMFFLSSFACFGLLDDAGSRAVMGTMLLGMAIALRWATARAHNDFLVQFSLAFVVAGQALVVSSFGEVWDLDTSAVAVEVVLALVLLVVFPDTVQRFASTVVASLGTAWLLADAGVPHVVDLAALVLGGGTVACWMGARQLDSSVLRPWRRAVGTGLTVALFGVLQTSVWPMSDYRPSWVTLLCMATLLLSVTAWVLAQQRVSLTSAPAGIALASALAIAAFAWQAPGVAAAGVVMLLAIQRRDPILLGLASLALIAFGSAFYYWLDVSLLAKSSVLVGTGVLLLGLRLVALRLIPAEAA